ncbi:MAG: carbohydrate kinase family protein [Anaerolineae bacterium]
MKRVVTLGDLVMDLIAPVSLPILPGQHQETGRLQPQPGGGCNFLIHAARLGLPVSCAGVVGDDPFGVELAHILRSEGVDTSPIFVAPGSTTTVVLDLIDQVQKAHTFIGHAAEGEPMPVTPLVESLIREAGAVFFQGYTLLEVQMQQPIPRMLQIATEAHVPVYYDVGPPSGYARPEQLELVLEHTDVLMMTEDEIPLIADEREGEEAYAWLFGQGVELLIVKRGPLGCLLVTPEGRESVPAYPVEVADTVGAGDCFNAGFLYGRMRGWSLTDSARLANASGGAAATKVGAGRNVPTLADIHALLSAHGVALDI